ncbi:MAG: cytochrome ubiquinol oxidase subunit I [Chitinophagales bacterium]|nr:cytochrome ubiquinol oxidase subunit I [Chitinophagales bacterium]
MGIACVLLVVSFLKIKENKIFLLRLILNFLLLFAVLTVMAGMGYEIEFRRFWPELYDALKDFNLAFGQKTTAIAYILSLPFYFIIYKWKLWESKYFYLVAIILFFHTLTYSLWGNYQNAVIQYPLYYYISEEGLFKLRTSFKDAFLSSTHLYRQLHLLGTSALLGVLFILMLLSLLKINIVRVRRYLLLFGILSVIVLAYSGHIQTENIEKYQPIKFAVMENIDTDNDIQFWKPIGVLSSSGKEFTFRFKNGPQEKLRTFIIPISKLDADKLPNMFLVYNSFRWMIYLGLVVLIIGVGLFLKPKYASFRILLLLFILSSISSGLGWILSEFGRYHYLIYDMLDKSDDIKISNLYESVILLTGNIILLCFAFYYGIKQAFIKAEKASRKEIIKYE